MSVFTLLMMAIAPVLGAQDTYNIQNATVRMDGTSTMHAWEMTSTNGSGTAKITFNSAGQVTSISGITYTLAANTLKSKTSGLDNNAYKALKTSKYPNITFAAATATATTNDGVNYQLKVPGKLTIAGTTKNIDMVFKGKLNADKSFTVAGNKTIKMTEYGVEPPSFMFGAMKTGNEITLTINSTLRK